MTALLAGATGVAAGTWLAGWIALPVSGAAVGAWLGWAARLEASRAQAPTAGSAGAPGARPRRPSTRPRRPSARRWAPVATAALAGVLGWGVLLIFAAARGPVADVARLVGGVLGGLPGPAFFLVVLLFAGLLAGAAGGLSQALVHMGGGAKSSSRKTE